MRLQYILKYRFFSVRKKYGLEWRILVFIVMGIILIQRCYPYNIQYWHILFAPE